jgi:hypothetical protein
MHLFADIGDVGKDRFLVAFAEELGWGDGVALLRGAGEEGGIGGM